MRTKEQAEELGIPLTTLGTPESRFSDLDVAIDGADEVDPALNLVKGGGGALLREKMVEICAEKFIVIVDESKLCDGLGPGFPLPVEITPFCWEHTLGKVAKLPSLAGCEAKLRLGSAATGSAVDGDEPAVTDNGNYIVDLFFKEAIKDAPKARRSPVAAAPRARARAPPSPLRAEPAEGARAVQAAEELKNTVGVVDHGLFCGLTTQVIVAGKEGVYSKP